VRFECQPGCINCCTQKGFVYVSAEDVTRLAAYLKMSRGAFASRYVIATKYRSRLRVPRAKQCPFLEEGGCSVHPAKPTQCKAFPFWPEFIRSKREWKKLGAFCPGIGKGDLVNIQLAQQTAQEMKESHPALYGD
jgi:Fe-S-cluster containining protein